LPEGLGDWAITAVFFGILIAISTDIGGEFPEILNPFDGGSALAKLVNRWVLSHSAYWNHRFSDKFPLEFWRIEADPHERKRAWSGRLGVERMLQKDLYLVAEGGLGLANHSGRKFKYGRSLNADCGHAPGLEVFFNVNDDAIAIKVNGVNRKAHGKGVNSARRVDPESLAARETG